MRGEVHALLLHRLGHALRGVRILLIVLTLLLILVAAVIVLRLREYAAGTAYYDGLRGLN